MKRPYLTEDDRFKMRVGTASGSFAEFDLRTQQLLREVRKALFIPKLVGVIDRVNNAVRVFWNI